ncbi:hypothetical protein Tsubulata_002690 [Turnera subulata]|uniref:Mechanosensitive ion channel protein n=1 Tax=Turnera subulata TaxID=218843 RepID=A0A9Q0J1W5_9ROSI|nr:hypothetical protein Tsubulata_002690 [Turnera subulata]
MDAQYNNLGEESFDVIQRSPLFSKLAPAIGVIVFTVTLGPLMRQCRNLLLHKNDNSWKKSNTYYLLTSYIQPLLLCAGAIFVCRALDPIVLPTEASQTVKERVLRFVKLLSIVLTSAYCSSSIIEPVQKFFMGSNEPNDARNMGFQFAGKVVYAGVWVAAFSLFMELLGFSTQKLLTAGGLGTVLLTLAGREIFTNFLSSVMMHANRLLVVNQWVQIKIDGYEVSGIVEHVSWWSPTIIRGEDGEAIHIPNHKITMNIVRNLSQKEHWRIKTHLNIVADMRKVVSKNPQIDQRAHRRVFFDDIDPENQGLRILVSCFVKTSHHEEYLCVKEAILLDLLRVIKHHGARLATKVLRVQRTQSDADWGTVPFSDSFYNRSGMASMHPLLLSEPSYKINGEDKGKQTARSGRTAGEQGGKTVSRPTPDTKAGGSHKSESGPKVTAKSDSKGDGKIAETLKSAENLKSATGATSEPKVGDKSLKSPVSIPNTSSNTTEKSRSSPKVAGSNMLTESLSVSDGKQPKSGIPGHVSVDGKFSSPDVYSSEAGADKVGGSQEASQSKQEKRSVPQSSMTRPTLDENIVLGVALEGSKRTLPIEEDIASPQSPADVKEMAAVCRNRTDSLVDTKDRKDGQIATPSNVTSSDQ